MSIGEWLDAERWQNYFIRTVRGELSSLGDAAATFSDRLPHAQLEVCIYKIDDGSTTQHCRSLLRIFYSDMGLHDTQTDVLIVGAGPAGATTAVLLGKMGIRSIAISRHAGTANTPRAHIFNQRAMEVLRDADLESVVSPIASGAHHLMHTSWLRSLNGEEYGRHYAFGNGPKNKGDYLMASPCEMSDLPQSLLEPVLVEQARKDGADVRFSTEFLSQHTTIDGLVAAQVRNRSSGQEYTIVSRYLIGADGARSAVLDSLEIPVDGHQLNTAFNVHLRAELSKYFAHRPGSLNWILNPDAPDWSAVGNFRMVRPWDEFVVSMHPADKNGKIFEPTEKDIIQRLHQMIGDESVPIELLSTFRWTINDQVARSWQKGNVICIGDATHRHPPVNGLGSNTCISDAMNLSWKLAYVLKGLVSPCILESITAERKPVGDAIVRRANDGMEVHRRLWEIIGLSSEERAERTTILSKASPEGQHLREQYGKALEAFDDELNALGIQMNQIYSNSPLTITEPNDDCAPDLSAVNLILQQVVSTYPGFHLPHVWVAKNGQSRRVSTLDLCGHGQFTLITGIGGEAWRERAKEIERQREGIVLRVVSIGWQQDYMDAYRDWARLREVEDSGAVLVRPDHFVSWRCRSVTSCSASRLAEVMDAILPRP